jgi:hypothetical protein
VQHRGQLVTAERAELWQGRRLSALGECREIAAGRLELALTQEGQHAAQHHTQHPGEQRRPKRDVAEHREHQQRDRDRQRQPHGAGQQPMRRHGRRRDVAPGQRLTF